MEKVILEFEEGTRKGGAENMSLEIRRSPRSPGKRFTEMNRRELLESRAYHQDVIDNPGPDVQPVGLDLFKATVRQIDEMLAQP